MSVPHPSSTQGQQDCADGHAPGRAGTVVEGLGPMSRPSLSPPTPPAVDSVFMQGLLTVPREQSQAQEYIGIWVAESMWGSVRVRWPHHVGQESPVTSCPYKNQGPEGPRPWAGQPCHQAASPQEGPALSQLQGLQLA